MADQEVVKFDRIDETAIERMVHQFYSAVRRDELIAGVFNETIGDHWDEHLQTMCRFWSSVLQTSGAYKGNPMNAHMRLSGVTPAFFERWLSLFAATTNDLFVPELAAAIQEKAQRIAQSLMLGMFYRPEAAATRSADI